MNPATPPTVGTARRRSHALGLTISMVINLVLVGLLRRDSSHPSDESGLLPRPMRVESAAHLQDSREVASAQRQSTATDPWSALAAGDYAGAVGLLRAAHCPEETIQDLVSLRMSRDALNSLEQRMSERRRGDAWWRASPRTVQLADRRDKQEIRARLEREFQEVLGISYGSATSQFFPWRGLGDASPITSEHQQAYDELMARHLAESDAIFEKGAFGSGGLLDGRQTAEMTALTARQRIELEQILSPEELESLAMRDSEAARVAKKYLPEARTEDQFRLMVRVAKELEITEEIPALPGEDEEKWSARMNAVQSGYRFRVMRMLGESEFEELERREAERRVQLEAREEARKKKEP